MCITVNHADLSKTKILSLPLENGNHFISYSNNVKNLSDKPNAMILPIPGETNPSLFHNTEPYQYFMNEILNKCRYEEDYLGEISRGFEFKSVSLSFDKFELGMYTVGLAKEFAGIREFLNQLSEEKRPEISEELKQFFEEKYAGWSFAICVFDSKSTIDAQPIAFEYKPFDGRLLYYPTMDGHDGGAPHVGAMVKTDHTLIYEHTGKMTNKHYAQQYVTLDAKVPENLQNRRYRAVFSKGYELNGDTFVNIDVMNEIDFSEDPEFKRIAPVPNVVKMKDLELEKILAEHESNANDVRENSQNINAIMDKLTTITNRKEALVLFEKLEALYNERTVLMSVDKNNKWHEASSSRANNICKLVIEVLNKL